MRLELACYGKNATFEEITKSVFVAETKRFSSISVLPCHINEVRSISSNVKVGSVIDYPYGSDLPQIRLASLIRQANLGLDHIDLVLNHSLITNKKDKLLLADIEAAVSIGITKKIKIGLMLDHQLFDTDTIIEIGHFCRQKGISYIVSSTLSSVGEMEDNLIASVLLQKKADIPVIVAANRMTDEYYTICKKNKIYGIRFESYLNAWLKETKFGVLKRG